MSDTTQPSEEAKLLKQLLEQQAAQHKAQLINEGVKDIMTGIGLMILGLPALIWVVSFLF